MEIESKKSKGLKRRNPDLLSLDIDGFKTPVKQMKKTSFICNPLTTTEKSFAYLLFKTGETDEKEIGHSLKRDKRTTKAFLEKAKINPTFTADHKSKGRWKKGATKLNERQKDLLQKWG